MCRLIVRNSKDVVADRALLADPGFRLNLTRIIRVG
jgi:hypothetical protein